MDGVIYCRVATKQTDNVALLSQLKACEAYCEREGIDIVGMFNDAGESGNTTDRPELQRLLAYCRTKRGRVQFVVVHDVTRLSRDAHDYALIRALLLDLGVKLRSVNEPINDDLVGKLTEDMVTAIEKFYTDESGARTTLAVAEVFEDAGEITTEKGR
jgi:site-specific DNA recombinase